MGSREAIAAMRAHALLQFSITRLVAQRIFLSRSDVAGQVPAIALEPAGGPGYQNQKYYVSDVRVHFWSSVNWAECYEVQNAFANVFEGSDYTQDGGALPEPLVQITAGAPQQMPKGDYYHLVQTYQVKTKEA
jgi:hypothetical protein